MPSSVRKSSVGVSRRGPQKAHIPFRGDNPEVGKKTGIAVQHVERKSDGFEPFEDIIRQADKRTPPTKARVKKRKLVPPSPAFEDGDGEMSMDMDDSNPNSPRHFFTNARVPVGPQSVNRVGSSSRPANRTSAVDFDAVPSPRPRIAASKRKSLTNGSAAGPSKLYKQSIVADPEPDPDLDDPGPEPDDSGVGGGDFDDYGPQENGSPEGLSPMQTSFMQMDQDDDDDDDKEDEQQVEESPVPASRKNGKGKERERPPEEAEEEQAEEEIAQGLNDDQRGESDQDEEDHPPPPNKKVRMEQQQGKRPRGRPKGELVQLERSETPEGVRRGQRHRYRPLEWWRQEKVVYGKRESGVSLVPHIKAILRIPKEEPVPLGKQGRKRGKAKSRSKSETVVVEEPPSNPEEGWDDKTPQQGVVLDFVSKEEVQRRIAFTARMVQPQAAVNNDWFFQKVFGDGDFIAAGQLIIPPKGRKPSKGTKDNTYVFYVIEGAVNLRVHDTSLILATGAMFMVPRGNTYFIENIAERDAKLFFTQARKIAMDEEEQAALAVPLPAGTPALPRHSPDMRRLSGGPSRLSVHRSSSTGAGPSGPTNGHVGVGGKQPDANVAGTKRAASTKI